MDTVLRVTLIYIFLMVAMRVVGKRELGRLSAFDLVVLLLIPEMLTDSLAYGDESLTNAFVGVATLLVLVYISSTLTYRFRSAERIMDGEPAVLVHEGSFVRPNMERERITPGEILMAVHEAGLERIAQVRWAILGVDGKISVVPAEPALIRPPEKEPVR
jgi:uncharacterized membrane protein YcaP (DUF421 family)